MSRIRKVLICGLGGLGCICATQILNSKKAELKILVDESRYEKYKVQETYFNNKPYKFEITLPQDSSYKADLIIIATKYDGLNFAIEGIKNFITENTIIISLLNGISSEEMIAQRYGYKNIILSFYIGHSCIRNDRQIMQDGNYCLMLGTRDSNKDNLKELAKFFDETGIKYNIPPNFQDEYWKKFMINVGINQLSAVTGLTLKEIKKDNSLVNKLKSLMKEVEQIAEKQGLYNSKEIYKAAENFLLREIEDAKPSMLQDIESQRKTEVDIFAGTVIKLGKKYGIRTPENNKIYNEIKELEKNAK